MEMSIREEEKKHEEFETNSKKHNNTPKHEKSLISCNPQHKTIRKHQVLLTLIQILTASILRFLISEDLEILASFRNTF
jgi:hypothetical protein